MFYKSTEYGEYYDFYDVFGKDKFFHPTSVVRIIGWETPASIIYKDDRRIKIRFKKSIEPFYNEYRDKPYNGNPSDLFYDKFLETYTNEEPLRRLKYAIEEYKKTTDYFEITPLFHKELEQKLNNSNLFIPAEYTLDDTIFNYSVLHNHSCYWFPVDIDAIITDFPYEESISRDEGMIVFVDGTIKYGRVGFDGNFYHLGAASDGKYQYNVYQLENGIKKLNSPTWLNTSQNPFAYKFFRHYVITPDNKCYNYNGDFLPTKTTHNQNTKLANDLIKLLKKPIQNTTLNTISLELVIPSEFTEFNIDDIEKNIAPYLSSINQLNETAFSNFLDVKAIIKSCGLSADFETAFKNIVKLNKSTIYGGSKRNICGLKLRENIQQLYKQIGHKEMARVLKDEIEFKTKIAIINGTPVVEHCVSDKCFQSIKDGRRVPHELKKSHFWSDIQPGTLVVFSNNSNEKLCVVTTNIKSGIGIKLV